MSAKHRKAARRAVEETLQRLRAQGTRTDCTPFIRAQTRGLILVLPGFIEWMLEQKEHTTPDELFDSMSALISTLLLNVTATLEATERQKIEIAANVLKSVLPRFIDLIDGTALSTCTTVNTATGKQTIETTGGGTRH